MRVSRADFLVRVRSLSGCREREPTPYYNDACYQKTLHSYSTREDRNRASKSTPICRPNAPEELAETPRFRGRLAQMAYYRCLIGSGEIAVGTELSTSETTRVVEVLNRILELELAGLVRYLHYSFMIFGHNRIPIVAWLRGQAGEAQAHAILAGEYITNLGGHPSLK